MRTATVAWCLALLGCAGGEYGERCENDEQCGGSLSCVGQAANQHCMYACTTENAFSCPDGYVCVGPRDLEPKACFQQCASDQDCPEPWRCTTLPSGTLCTFE